MPKQIKGYKTVPRWEFPDCCMMCKGTQGFKVGTKDVCSKHNRLVDSDGICPELERKINA